MSVINEEFEFNRYLLYYCFLYFFIDVSNFFFVYGIKERYQCLGGKFGEFFMFLYGF